MSGINPTSDQRRAMAQAFNMPVPQVVFNGYAHNYSATEFTSVLSLGPRMVLSLLMTPSVAKSFAQSLLEVVESYEAATGAAVSTIAELAERIAAYEAREETPPEATP